MVPHSNLMHFTDEQWKPEENWEAHFWKGLACSKCWSRPGNQGTCTGAIQSENLVNSEKNLVGSRARVGFNLQRQWVLLLYSLFQMLD